MNSHKKAQKENKRHKRFCALWSFFVLFVVSIFLFDISALAQCSMCRTALEASAEGQAIAGGFRKGILVLLAAPYIVFGTVSFAVYRAYRKKTPKE